MELILVWFFDLVRFGLFLTIRLRFFGFRLIKPKPNRTEYFLKYSNWFNWVFLIVQFF
jgi:hypothetical protein